MDINEIILNFVNEGNFLEVYSIINCNENMDINYNLRIGKIKNTLLMEACCHGYIDIVEVLLRHKANVNSKNKRGETALIMACKSNFYNIIELLLRYNANANAQTKIGNTPLIAVCHHPQSQARVVRLLLENKANMVKGNNSGYTPLMLASQNNNSEVVELLLNYSKENKKKLSNSNNCPNDNYLRPISSNGNINEFNQRNSDIPKIRIFNENNRYSDYSTIFTSTSTSTSTTNNNNNNYNRNSNYFNKNHMMDRKYRSIDMDSNYAVVMYDDDRIHSILSQNQNSNLSNNFYNINYTLSSYSNSNNNNNANEDSYGFPLNNNSNNISDVYSNSQSKYSHHQGELTMKQKSKKILKWIKPQHQNVTHLIKLNQKYVNFKNKKGNTALILACKSGAVEVARLLLQNKATIETKNKKGLNALMYACKYSCTPIVKLLLQYHVSIDEQSNEGETALMLATGSESVEIVELLLRHKANVNIKKLFGRTALMYACWQGNLEIVKLLLKYNADINMQNDCGDTALMYANRNKHESIIQLLIENHADINIKNKDNETELILSLKELNYTYESYTYDQPNNYQSYRQDYHYYKEMIQRLLTYRADVNVKNNKGNTALIYLCLIDQENIDILEFILKNGANVNEQNNNGDTALMYACRNRKNQTVDLLLKHNANVNIKNNYGETALMFACSDSSYDEHEFGGRNHSYGRILLPFQQQQQNYQVVRQLLKNNCQTINDKNCQGYTALMMASENGYYKIVEELLNDHGAKINLRNDAGNTALMLASLNGRNKIVQLLLAYKENLNDRILEVLIQRKRLIQSQDLTKQKKQQTQTKKPKKSKNSKKSLTNDKSHHLNSIHKLKWKLNLFSRPQHQPMENQDDLMLNLLNEHLYVNEAEIDYQNNDGNTALMLSLKYKNYDTFRLLLDHGANVNLNNNKGNSALLLLVKDSNINKYDFVRCVNLLFHYEANFLIQDNEKKDIIYYARRNNNFGMIELLQDLITIQKRNNIK